ERLRGRELGEAVASAMVTFSRRLGFPTTLSELPAFTQEHIEKALAAAKNPQLTMKLAAMPVPMEAATVDRYMRPVLRAASTGSFTGIQNV
ncbi:MAG: iron-containing alcohol dehydrogenase, partial [Planctomycetota bacterium]